MEHETLIGFLLRAVITRIKLLERVDLLLGKLDGLRHHCPEHVFSVGRCGQRTIVTEEGSLVRRRQQGAGVLTLDFVTQRRITGLGYFCPKILDQLMGAPFLDHHPNDGQRIWRGFVSGQRGRQFFILLVGDDVN